MFLRAKNKLKKLNWKSMKKKKNQKKRINKMTLNRKRAKKKYNQRKKTKETTRIRTKIKKNLKQPLHQLILLRKIMFPLF